MNYYLKLVTKHYKLVLFLMSFIFLSLAFFSKDLRIDASAETLLLENDKDLMLTREIHSRYASENFLVLAYSPKDDLLSRSTLKNIKDLSEDLSKISGVKEVVSLLDVALLQSPPLGIAEALKGIKSLKTMDSFDVDLVKAEFSTSPLYAQNLVSKDFKTTAILIRLEGDKKREDLIKSRNHFVNIKESRSLTKDELANYESIKEEIKKGTEASKNRTHELIKELRSTISPYKNDAEIILGGVDMITDDMISFVKDDILKYSGAIFVLMSAMLWLFFRQLRFVVLPLFIASIAIVISTGVIAFLGLDVTVVSSNFVSMQLISTLSLNIHIIVSYRENYHADLPHSKILSLTLSKMATPSLYIILTTAAGFISLMNSGILPITHLGYMMSIGIASSLICTYLLFPSIMMTLGKKEPSLTFDQGFSINDKFAHIIEHHGRYIIAVAVIFTLFSIFGANRLIVENSFINYFKQDTEIFQGMKKIDKKLGGTTPLEVVIRFDEAPKVATLESEDSFLDEFLDELSVDEHDPTYWFNENKMQTILKVHNYLASQKELGHVSSLGTLAHVGRILKDGKDFDSFEMALLYKELPPEHKKLLISPFVDIDHSEARFVARVIDSNDELRRDELLKRIQSELHTVVGLKEGSYHLAGIMVLYNNMLQSLFSSQILTLGFAVLLIGSMFLILFRSIKVALLAMVVNVVPVSIVFGIMGTLGIPLDMMSITVASIALGIAVDNTIHYYYRFRSELTKDGNYIGAMRRSHKSIAFGMFYYSLATIVGFLVLVTSNFVPTLIFGLLVVLVLIAATASDLILSPYLVVKFKPFGKPKVS